MEMKLMKDMGTKRQVDPEQTHKNVQKQFSPFCAVWKAILRGLRRYKRNSGGRYKTEKDTSEALENTFQQN